MRGGEPGLVFFFNDTATTEIYTLSLHDALPILVGGAEQRDGDRARAVQVDPAAQGGLVVQGVPDRPGRWVWGAAELQLRLPHDDRLVLASARGRLVVAVTGEPGRPAVGAGHHGG